MIRPGGTEGSPDGLHCRLVCIEVTRIRQVSVVWTLPDEQGARAAGPVTGGARGRRAGTRMKKSLLGCQKKVECPTWYVPSELGKKTGKARAAAEPKRP